MNKIVVSWSSAYDNIMHTDTNLKEHLAKKEMWKISISYLSSSLKKEVWGTWLNIAYNIALLWAEPILFTSVWTDFSFSDFVKNNINLDYVYFSKDKLSSRSYITTDNYKNQITSFYPWSMEDIYPFDLDKNENVLYGIVSANNISCMKDHLKKLHERGVKTFFDPGQQITQMNKEDLDYCIKYSDFIILSEYEYEVLKSIAEKTDWDMIDTFDHMILTYWLEWSKIFDKNYNIIEIHWVENPNFKDPTGAWDAYRAGLIKWLNDWYSWETSARIGAVLSSLCTWKFWAQNHFIDWNKFSSLYEQTFWESL